MQRRELTQFIKYLSGSGDFIETVKAIYLDNIECVDADRLYLLQMDEAGTHAETIITLDRNSGFVDSAYPVTDTSSEDYFKNTFVRCDNNGGELAVSPVFLQERIAMYIVAVKDEGELTKEALSYIAQMSIVIQNVATNRNFQVSLESSFNIVQNALDEIPIGVAILDDKEKNILLMNQVALNSTAIQNAMGMGLIRHMETGETYIEEIYEDETGLWFDVGFTDLKWIHGEDVLMCTVIDITQKVKNQQRIEYQANNDYLTGLFNRMKCERDLNEVIKKAVENKERGVLLFLDLDNFKQVNDGLGHQYGDMLLQEIAGAIQSIPQIANCCYRMGGDEFVIIIKPEYFGEITEIVDIISKRFNEPWKLLNVEYYCTMSMGLAIYPEHAVTVSDVIKKADYAMYEAKKEGKNRYRWYTDKDDTDKQKQGEFQDAIKNMVGNEFKDFELHYQPVMDRDGKLMGAEALVRINSGKIGKLMPAEFLPAAEYLGLMNRIGNYVLAKACETLASWNEKISPDFKMFVNIAPAQITMSKACDQIMDIIKSANAIPENVCFDVSERTEFRDERTLSANLEILSAHGVNIVVDDFGSGRMSLAFIKQIKATAVKFDSSFLRDNGQDTYNKAIAATVSALSSELGLKIGYVGVETEAQKNFAIDSGADFLEGFYYGETLSQDEFEKKWILT